MHKYTRYTFTTTHTMTPRGDEGQTGLIVSSSRSRERIDFSHSPLSTHLLLTRSSTLFISLSLQRTLHNFLVLPPLSCSSPFLKPHFFFASMSLLPLLHFLSVFCVVFPPLQALVLVLSSALNGDQPPPFGSTQKPSLISVRQCNSKIRLRRCHGHTQRASLQIPWVIYLSPSLTGGRTHHSSHLTENSPLL